MNILKCILIAAILTIFGCATMRVDPGGHFSGYVERITRTQQTKEMVIIDYECDSACLILLSSGPGLRISKHSRFGVHEARFVVPGTNYWDDTSRRTELGTNYLKSQIPECAVKLFETKHAFDRPDLTYFTGAQVLKACPEIQEYIAK